MLHNLNWQTHDLCCTGIWDFDFTTHTAHSKYNTDGIFFSSRNTIVDISDAFLDVLEDALLNFRYQESQSLSGVV